VCVDIHFVHLFTEQTGESENDILIFVHPSTHSFISAGIGSAEVCLLGYVPARCRQGIVVTTLGTDVMYVFIQLGYLLDQCLDRVQISWCPGRLLWTKQIQLRDSPTPDPRLIDDSLSILCMSQFPSRLPNHQSHPSIQLNIARLIIGT